MRPRSQSPVLCEPKGATSSQSHTGRHPWAGSALATASIQGRGAELALRRQGQCPERRKQSSLSLTRSLRRGSGVSTPDGQPEGVGLGVALHSARTRPAAGALLSMRDMERKQEEAGRAGR